jgi:hypothetical protein
MEQLKGLSIFFGGAFACAGLYAILRGILSTEELIILLNGLFAGAITGVAVAYGPLIWYAVLGRQPYDRVWQMTLGFAILWLAVCVGVANSVFFRATGADIPYSELTPIARYLAIVAACVQVTAPDFGLGIFHGRDRKVLWTATALGLLVAVVVIAMQQWGSADAV